MGYFITSSHPTASIYSRGANCKLIRIVSMDKVDDTSVLTECFIDDIW